MDNPARGTDGAKPTGLAASGMLVCVRACILAAPLIIAVVLLAYLTGTYAPHFHILAQRNQLPAITEQLLHYAAANRTWLFVPSGAILAVVLVTDLTLACIFDRAKYQWIYWAWFVTAVLAELLAIAYICVGLLVPIAQMGL